MKLKCKELTKNIYHIIFPSRRELAKTFLRFQEHFESPAFRKKIFTLNEFKKWYISHSPGGKKTEKFTYYEDWNGFNIPSKILNPFYQGKFNPLSNEEKSLLKLFENKKKKKFYIIATYKNSGKYLLQHEIAHGLFYTSLKYRREVLKALRNCDKETIKELHGYFSTRGGYHPAVWLDETHTHIMADLRFLKREEINSSKMLKVRKELNSIFNKYFN